MKKLVIAGSSKLYERALYWRGYFEGRGYEVIDWTRPIFENEDFSVEEPPAPGFSLGRLLTPGDSSYAERLIKCYQNFYRHLDQADTFFLMNEDQHGIEGYIGTSAIAELVYVVMGNLNRGRKVDIQILKMPSKEQNCYNEVKFWLDQEIIEIFHRPTGKKATIPVADNQLVKSVESGVSKPVAEPALATTPTAAVTEGEVVESLPRKTGLFGRGDKTIDIVTCKKRCLRSLRPEVRQYLKILSPEFPAWLLKYIAAPEMQRLIGLGMSCGLDHSSLYTYPFFHTVFEHSIGAALIVWNFTHDKKQTLSSLFHDIATPAFKHAIDFMNNDAETQESTEERTAQIIRESRAITKQLKKDGILPSEVSDYHLHPIADNPVPGVASDRLEYTFSNGIFMYDIWDPEKVKTFYQDLTILKNENDLDELGFQTPELANEFTKLTLPLFSIYHNDKSRANMQFIADIIQSMINSGYLTVDDLYVMSEREVVDWILSCGDRPVSDAFRQFQRATTVFSSGVAKKNCYCISTKSKVRYMNPLVRKQSAKTQKVTVKRLSDLDDEIEELINDYLAEKQPKYVGFDFDFKPYTTAE